MPKADVKETLEKAASEIITLTGKVKTLEGKLANVEKDNLAKKVASQMLDKQLLV